MRESFPENLRGERIGGFGWANDRVRWVSWLRGERGFLF